jgi:dihydrolipoamide dehydrogenase
MNELHVDVAVIGAGTAGLAAYRAAKSHGKRVILIEGGAYGTTCARVGCMPSKLLIAAADAAYAITEAPGFGVHGGPLRIDGRAVMARVRAERDRFVGLVLEGMERIAATDRLSGHAQFIDAQHVQVGDHTLVSAGRVVIATGAHPQIPALLRGIDGQLVVNDDVFEWTDLPESVAVIGTGVLGLELGQALQRLGVRVALFGRDGRIGQLTDPVVRDAAAHTLSRELDLRLYSTVLAVQTDGDRVQLRYRAADGGEHTEHYAYVLAATGRIPNVKGLGLELTGLELDEQGIPLFDPHTMRCGNSTIFIAGDADLERPLLHEAADQGRIAGDNAGAFPEVRPGLRYAALNIAFTDPQIAIAGQAWRDLPKGNFACGEVSFVDQGRSRVMRQNRGLLRVYGEYGTNRFLGAEMLGPRAEHLAHLLAWACQSGLTVQAMLTMPFYHPVIEEGVRTALRDLSEKLLGGLPEIERCADCVPGV